VIGIGWILIARFILLKLTHLDKINRYDLQACRRKITFQAFTPFEAKSKICALKPGIGAFPPSILHH